MVASQLFNSQSPYAYQDGDQLPLELFDQVDDHPWNDQWTGQRPQPYGPSEEAPEDDNFPQQPTDVTPQWPINYHPAVDGDDYAAWDGNPSELASQLYSTYTTGTTFLSQGAQSDTSSPTTHYQASSVTSHDYQHPWSIPYAQPDLYSDTTPSVQLSTNKIFEKTPRPTQHQSNHPGNSKGTRPSSGHHKTRKKRGETSESASEPENGHYPPQGKTHKERNRLAATKFRSRKREGTDKMKVDEEALERRNRQLSSSVKELTQEVYQLKMQLLKHSDCDCTLIQDYIQSEAHRYIHGIQPKMEPE